MKPINKPVGGKVIMAFGAAAIVLTLFVSSQSDSSGGATLPAVLGLCGFIILGYVVTLLETILLELKLNNFHAHGENSANLQGPNTERGKS